MSYSSLDDGLEYFLMDGIGYIAYISFRHPIWAWKEHKLVLADPVCAHSDYQQIVRKFVERYPRTTFVQASARLADVLHQQGYQVNQFGIETELELATFNLQGKHRSKLRQWRNKCRREGVVIHEKPVSLCDNIQEIRDLSNQWLSTRGGKEYSFLTRKFQYEDEPGVRNFWAYQQGKLIAFAVFDPVYEESKVIGYYHNVDRIDRNAPHGVSASIILHAINVFREEGVQFVSLGMSPLYQLGKHYHYNKFTRDALRYAFDNLNFIYPFKGNASHKKKFNGSKKPVYFSSTRGNTLWQVFVMMKAMDVF